MKKIVIALTAIVLLLVSGCTSSSRDEPSSQQQGQKQTEQAFGQQSKAVPYPAEALRDSQERRNLKERLLRQNKPNRIGYVYILSFGKFLGYYTIKGKISSTQSQMTTDQLVSGDMCGSSCSEHIVTTAPGDDGSYGPNEDGVFFFTNDGSMVQISTEYIYSDQPLSVGSIPELNK